MALTKKLEELSRRDISNAGGKGSSLGELINKDMPVPPGFVILTKAFEDFLTYSNLHTQIQDILEEINTDETDSVEEASKQIQSLILKKKLSKEHKNYIIKEFEQLHAKFVAVRSSATSEDSASAAWAGQLDTYLNTTEKTLIKNIQKCWASLFTTRALFYRFKKQLNKKRISVAVVVQKMVDSEKSGIAFSANPVTNNTNQILIEAGLGLGEAIVSGQVTPDSYTFDKLKSKILNTKMHTQSKGLFRKHGGGNEWKDLATNDRRQVLDKKEIVELSQLILKIERMYGFPCDIEWAQENGKFYIVQSRPITTLESAASKSTEVSEADTIPKWKVVVTRRVSAFRAFVMAEGSQDDMKKYIGAPADALVVTRDELSSYHLKLFDLRAISASVIANIKNNPKFPTQHVKDCLSSCEKLVAVSKWCDDTDEQKHPTNAYINNAFKKYYSTYKNFAKFVIIPVAIEQAITNNIVEFLSNTVGKTNVQKYLAKLTTPPKLPAVQQEQVDLIELAIKNLQSHVNNRTTLLKHHHDTYRWLSCYNIDEKPFAYSYFETKLEGLMKLGERSLIKQLKAGKKQIKDDEISYKKTIKELNIRGTLLGQIELLRQYVWLRTYRIEMQSQSNFYIQSLFKKIAAIHGRTLREVVALSPEEIHSLLNGTHVPKLSELKARIKSYVLLSEAGKIQCVYGKEGQQIVLRELGEEKGGKEESVRGTPAYRGNVKGTVRILVRKKDLAKFKKAEILVTTMTTPEFVPAIVMAKAIVTDEGGVLCHAAIMAREFKIPCVIGTQKATRIFKNGDPIEVDANTGVVRLLKKS